MGVIKTLEHKLESVEKQIGGLRYDHRLLFDILERIEHKIDIPRMTSKSSENLSINQPFIKTPINTEDELQALEAKLINHDQNNEFRSQLIVEITWSMGKDIKHSIKRIFEKLFNDELLSQYSFHGIRNKKSFSSLNICSTIFEAIRKETKFKNVQHKEVEDCTQKYLAQRPFVVKRKKAATITNTENDN
ncbi:uncharacterized protein LOC132953245 [Metopolophium dirhodum]|uniref:uncharacterized protein LOC132938236 n=1 Tax=Metopolophium dirhodum TaxID=44670 RepID=UPI00299000A9|nr:uncharacterized protein LOC132938236 [Metopolophium dirhodum]XP_060873845.1 uncharacterized protein LOC132947560 [Metopolophium dirhodum]XP_060881748.1 uncharacterized protein LOC132953245 [Metopolophium dirhodum]